MLALSFTVILIQVQTSAQGIRYLMPILIAGLLALAGVTRHDLA
jgi:hypothetical protein